MMLDQDARVAAAQGADLYSIDGVRPMAEEAANNPNRYVRLPAATAAALARHNQRPMPQPQPQPQPLNPHSLEAAASGLAALTALSGLSIPAVLPAFYLPAATYNPLPQQMPQQQQTFAALWHQQQAAAAAVEPYPAAGTSYAAAAAAPEPAAAARPGLNNNPRALVRSTSTPSTISSSSNRGVSVPANFTGIVPRNFSGVIRDQR